MLDRRVDAYYRITKEPEAEKEPRTIQLWLPWRIIVNSVPNSVDDAIPESFFKHLDSDIKTTLDVWKQHGTIEQPADEGDNGQPGRNKRRKCFLHTVERRMLCCLWGCVTPTTAGSRPLRQRSTTVQCDSCGLGKAKGQVRRQPWEPCEGPGLHLAIDFHGYYSGYRGFAR
jgi:hypothetical protein